MRYVRGGDQIGGESFGAVSGPIGLTNGTQFNPTADKPNSATDGIGDVNLATERLGRKFVKRDIRPRKRRDFSDKPFDLAPIFLTVPRW